MSRDAGLSPNPISAMLSAFSTVSMSCLILATILGSPFSTATMRLDLIFITIGSVGRPIWQIGPSMTRVPFMVPSLGPWETSPSENAMLSPGFRAMPHSIMALP